MIEVLIICIYSLCNLCSCIIFFWLPKEILNPLNPFAIESLADQKIVPVYDIFPRYCLPVNLHCFLQATSKCKRAKEELERICRDLSGELSGFDYRKEQEIKNIFIEYTESKFQRFEQVCWKSLIASRDKKLLKTWSKYHNDVHKGAALIRAHLF